MKKRISFEIDIDLVKLEEDQGIEIVNRIREKFYDLQKYITTEEVSSYEDRYTRISNFKVEDMEV